MHCPTCTCGQDAGPSYVPDFVSCVVCQTFVPVTGHLCRAVSSPGDIPEEILIRLMERADEAVSPPKIGRSRTGRRR